MFSRISRTSGGTSTFGFAAGFALLLPVFLVVTGSPHPQPIPFS
jgi:hypothetical protein